MPFIKKIKFILLLMLNYNSTFFFYFVCYNFDVIFMKKKLYSIFLALLLGGIMAFITIKKFSFASKTYTVSIYQLGVYKNYDNALSKALNAKGAIIVSKDDTYQVIGAIASSTSSKNKLENLLKEEELNYYEKMITLDEESKKTIDEYELLINKTDDLEVLKKLNEQLLLNISERMN